MFDVTVSLVSRGAQALPATTAHGTAVLAAGDTQVLASATVGNSADVRSVTTLLGEESRPLITAFACPGYASSVVRMSRLLTTFHMRCCVTAKGGEHAQHVDSQWADVSSSAARGALPFHPGFHASLRHPCSAEGALQAPLQRVHTPRLLLGQSECNSRDICAVCFHWR